MYEATGHKVQQGLGASIDVRCTVSGRQFVFYCADGDVREVVQRFAGNGAKLMPAMQRVVRTGDKYQAIRDAAEAYYREQNK